MNEVRRGQDGISHWTVSGPAGVPVSFRTTITRFISDQEIAWKTLPGSPIQHSGIVRFLPEGDGTRLEVTMSYNPLFGALGHGVAAAFGVDPKRAMDEDFVRLKSLIEEGKTTARGSEVTWDKLTR